MNHKYERSPVAERIKVVRESAGLSMNETAQALEITEMAYHDLEAHDDDAFMSVSLFQLGTLADLTGVELPSLLSPSNRRSTTQVTIDELIQRVVGRVRDRSETIETYSGRVGWEVADAITAPQSAWRSWNVDQLQDISKDVGVDWLDVVASWPGRCVA